MVINTYMHFVQKYYSEFRDVRDGFVVHKYESNHREPFGINSEEGMFGFNFYSVPKTISDTGTSSGQPMHYSEMFYFGKRYTYDELIMMKRIEDANFLKESGVTEGIFCDNGSIIVGIDKDAKTIDELKRDSLLKFGDFVNVSRMTFFNGLVSVLGIFEKDVTSALMEKRCRDSSEVKKEFLINVNGAPVFKNLFVEQEKNGVVCLSTIKFNEALKMLYTLCNEFPYLEEVADNVSIEVLGRGNPDFDIAMVEAAINIASNSGIVDVNSVLVKSREQL